MVPDIRTIGLPALLSFHTVARQGGISAAATHLGMAKSGVSRHIAQLEAQFGVKLLERSARSVKLTPVGARLDQRIQSILAEVDLLGDIAREESAAASGQVNIAATPEFGGMVANHLFPAVHALHPRLTLAMRPAYEFEDMQDPGTDLAFRVGSFKDDRLIARELGAFRCFVVAAPDCLAQHPVAAPGDLTGVPCMAFRGDRVQASWRLFSDNSDKTIDVSGPFAIRSFTILRELAMAGQGFAFLPDFMLTEDLATGRLVNALPGHVSRAFPVYLTYRPNARRIARLDAVISVALDLVPAILDA